MNNTFWQTKSLFDMTHEEWESVCDGCAKCCLIQLQDEQTEQLVFTDVACDLLDCQTCQCTAYSERSVKVPTCMTMTKENVKECAEFAPESCAYRLLLEQKPLPEWHHLVCGDRDSVHKQKHSVQNRVRYMKQISADDLEDYIVDWPQIS